MLAIYKLDFFATWRSSQTTIFFRVQRQTNGGGLGTALAASLWRLFWIAVRVSLVQVQVYFLTNGSIWRVFSSYEASIHDVYMYIMMNIIYIYVKYSIDVMLFFVGADSQFKAGQKRMIVFQNPHETILLRYQTGFKCLLVEYGGICLAHLDTWHISKMRGRKLGLKFDFVQRSTKRWTCFLSREQVPTLI